MEKSQLTDEAMIVTVMPGPARKNGLNQASDGKL